jgi:hypothetical protein
VENIMDKNWMQEKRSAAYKLASKDIEGLNAEINNNIKSYCGDGIIIYLKPIAAKGHKELFKTLENKGWKKIAFDRDTETGRVREYSKIFNV